MQGSAEGTDVGTVEFPLWLAEGCLEWESTVKLWWALLESAFAELRTGSREDSEIRDIVELVWKKEIEGIRRGKDKDRDKEKKKKKQRIKHYNNHDFQIKKPCWPKALLPRVRKKNGTPKCRTSMTLYRSSQVLQPLGSFSCALLLSDSSVFTCSCDGGMARPLPLLGSQLQTQECLDCE